MFVRLWNQVSMQPDDDHVAKIWERITEGYCESHRYYHSQRHILFCLRQFERVEDTLTDRVAVGLATWFHDVILDPAANAAANDGEREISAPDSKVRVLVIPTNEERVVARETQRLIEHKLPSGR